MDRAANMYPDTPIPAPVAAPSDSSPQDPETKLSRKQLVLATELQPTFSHLPYSIVRTPTKNLPIYQSTKAGGSKHITTIRKIKGDLAELATSVRTALGMEEHVTDMRGRRKANVVINWTTKHVVIRGWRAPEIKRWAEMTGF